MPWKNIRVRTFPVVVDVSSETGTFSFRKNEVDPFHFHAICELHFIYRGAIEVCIGSAARRYIATDGTMYFIRAGDLHRQKALKDTRMCYIGMVVSRVPKGGIYSTERSPSLTARQMDDVKGLSDYASAVFPATARLKQYIGRFVQGYLRKQSATGTLERYFHSLVVELCGVLRRRERSAADLEERLERASPREQRVVRAALAIMRSSLRDPLRLSRIAQSVHVGERQVQRAFRSVTGCPPIGYFMALRIEHAKRLLKSTALKIEQVIAESGFSNKRRFYRYFRAQTGSSPREFRRSYPGPVLRRKP